MPGDTHAGRYRLDERVAVVTGANSGMGRAISTAYAAAGARVLLVGRHDGRRGLPGTARMGSPYCAAAGQEATMPGLDDYVSLFGAQEAASVRPHHAAAHAPPRVRRPAGL